MKKFILLFLISIFTILLIGSVDSIYGDHLELGKGIFKEQSQANIITNEDGQYQIYLQLIIRNENGQLINVTESTAIGSYIDHKITDNVFNQIMGEKEIITIDDTKYEKAEWQFSPTLEERFIGLYPIYSEITLEIETGNNDTMTKMHELPKEYSIWKMHYCGDFTSIGHDFQCVPIFQVLIPTMTLEPTDTVDKKWTILKQID